MLTSLFSLFYVTGECYRFLHLFNKLTSVFLCVCPVIDNEFRHNIVKVAVDARGDSRVHPETTLTIL